jgi:hypothetical protein
MVRTLSRPVPGFSPAAPGITGTVRRDGKGACMHVITGVHGAHLEDYIASELPADVDVVASICRFAAVLSDRISNAYPTTSVEVRCDLDIIGGLPWDHQTHVLDPLPGVLVAGVIREIEELRRSITDDEWLVYLPSMNDSQVLHVGVEMEHQEQSYA